MNPPVNRKAESPQPPNPPLPPQAPAIAEPIAVEIPEESTVTNRKVPIPEPSHPRQYRAIGLVKGIYEPSAEQITRGTLATADGMRIDAVLLGRLISLIKNHIDLTQEHLWVVYPRTRQTNDHLHIQIVGIWEPETLDKEGDLPTEPQTDIAQDGFFSIRGEVVYASPDKEVVILKIRQSPKKEAESPKFFKVKLNGVLSDRPVGHFWDLKAQIENYDLIIQEANDLGFIKKKPLLRTDKKRPFQKREGGRPNPGESRPKFGDKPNTEKRPVSKPIITKPTINKPLEE